MTIRAEGAGDVIVCKTVNVTVGSDMMGERTLTIPAYTRETSEWLRAVADAVANYMGRSHLEDEPLSVGDFALYLLTVASMEPKMQEG